MRVFSFALFSATQPVFCSFDSLVFWVALMLVDLQVFGSDKFDHNLRMPSCFCERP